MSRNPLLTTALLASAALAAPETLAIELSYDDTSLRENIPGTTFETSNVLPVAGDPASGAIARSLILPDLTPIAGEAQVASATLTLTKAFTWNGSGAGEHTVNLVAIDSSWAVDSATWNSQPAYGDVIASFLADIDDSSLTTYQVDLTSLVNDWLAGSKTNYGFALIVADEDLVFRGNAYYSEDEANAGYAPVISIVVPEPGAMSLLAAGGLLLLHRRRVACRTGE
jgi:hypothetical protein